MLPGLLQFALGVVAYVSHGDEQLQWGVFFFFFGARPAKGRTLSVYRTSFVEQIVLISGRSRGPRWSRFLIVLVSKDHTRPTEWVMTIPTCQIFRPVGNLANVMATGLRPMDLAGPGTQTHMHNRFALWHL